MYCGQSVYVLKKPRTVYRAWCKTLKERGPLQDLVVDVRILIETVLKRIGQEGEEPEYVFNAITF